jgi:hypothetical protein
MFVPERHRQSFPFLRLVSYNARFFKMKKKSCFNVPTLTTETARHWSRLLWHSHVFGARSFMYVQYACDKSQSITFLMCPSVVGQNRLARRVFGRRRGGPMMEPTAGLPCLNLKSSENCHRYCTTCALLLFDLLRARYAK